MADGAAAVAPPRPLLIGIGGPTASGKTTLAHSLADDAGIPRSRIVHQDVFQDYRGVVVQPSATLPGVVWNNQEPPSVIAWALFIDAIKAAAAAAAAAGEALVVVEGYHLFSDPSVSALLDVKLLLDVPRAESQRRRAARSVEHPEGYVSGGAAAGAAAPAAWQAAYFDECIWPSALAHRAAALATPGVALLPADVSPERLLSAARSAVLRALPGGALPGGAPAPAALPLSARLAPPSRAAAPAEQGAPCASPGCAFFGSPPTRLCSSCARGAR